MVITVNRLWQTDNEIGRQMWDDNMQKMYVNLPRIICLKFLPNRKSNNTEKQH